MTPKERAEFALNRVNRWLLAGNREVAAYHIEQSIIAAENERARQEREACALQVDWLASGASGDAKARLEHIAAMLRGPIAEPLPPPPDGTRMERI